MWPFNRKNKVQTHPPGPSSQATAVLAGATFSPATATADSPLYSATTHRLAPLPDCGRVPVVGESHYQRALHLAASGRAAGDGFDRHIGVTAVLVPEPTNKWDRNAVRVDVVMGMQSLKVGYLSMDLAAEYQPELLKLARQGVLGTCDARIAGGGAKMYGIYLHLGTARDLRFANGTEDPIVASESNGSALLRSDWSCTVTKEENHQDVLARYAPRNAAQPREVIASLGFCKIEGGKYKGLDTVEVRIDGHRVGQLTYAMTQRYGAIVRSLLSRNLVVTCEAVTTRTARGVEVELGMPADPNRVRRLTSDR